MRESLRPVSWLTFLAIALSIAPSIAPSIAAAQQPLSEFLESASDRAFDIREAEAALSQARSQVDEARGRLLPSFTAQAGYTRNEFEAAFPDGMGGVRVIQPYDGLSAQFVLNVPLIDIGAWSGFFQAEAYGDAAEAQADLSRLTVEGSVVQLWYSLVGARAFVRAAERNVATLESNLAAAQARVEVGVAPQLELSRAEAEVARARTSLAEARLQATLGARNIADLTGLAPDDREAPLTDDLSPEGPMARFLDASDTLPAVRAARSSAHAADIAADTAWTALLPVISAQGRESGSNAVGFVGQNWQYAITLQASWTLDFIRPAQISTRAAQSEIAMVRAERVLQQVQTGIFEAYQRVETSRAQAASAEAAMEASRHAAEDARARFEAGAATQLDVIQAERDMFQAEVAHIQAIATLRVARAVLRIRAGMEPER